MITIYNKNNNHILQEIKMHHILYMQIIKMINKILFLNTYNNKQIVEIKKKIEIKMILDKK